MSEENKFKDSKAGGAYNDSSQDLPENRLDQVKSLVESLRHNLDKISRIVDKIQQDQKKEMYKKMPGIEGEFDGAYLVAEDGSKHEVPANYAAKSRLVYGDKLKIVEEDGKKVFKQIQKLDRKEVKGVLSKKEGKWYLLADEGTYKISDIAAEFNQVQLNEKAVALVPENQINAPFAALDRVLDRPEIAVPVAKAGQLVVGRSVQNSARPTSARPSVVEPKPVVAPQIKLEKKEAPKVKVEIKPAVKTAPTKKPPFIRPREEKKEVKKPVEVKTETPAQKEYVAGILEDDDLR